jgi:ribosomal protein S26
MDMKLEPRTTCVHEYKQYIGSKFGMYSPMFLQCIHCGEIIPKDEPFPKIEQSH